MFWSFLTEEIVSGFICFVTTTISFGFIVLNMNEDNINEWAEGI